MAKVVAFPGREPDCSPRSDLELLRACSEGDTAALGELFDRHHGAAWRFLRRMISGPDADVDDLLQSAFETVFASAGKFRGEAEVRTWILGIARNTARRWLRGSRRRAAFTLTLVEEPVPGETADEAALRKERLERIERGLESLSPKLREVVVLVYGQGLSGAECAAVLGIREGAIWKRLHTARKQLRHLLVEEES